ncbi:MAG: ATP-dependent helicase HrpB [Oceanospirillaceae bacterium]|nr:ATP-dependent helicase HrpB [Oceanospirillaceae bacterium]
MPAPFSSALPIDELIDDIRHSLADSPNLLLTAEPGAGKTTRVAPALLDAAWLNGQRIIMLEPRRIAARNAALFMAAQRQENIGETVGYRIRLENRVSEQTRIEIVTEGILTRMLQDDPELSGVGLIIFDEFHERHLASDLALALAHQCQQLLRPDLRLLIMSATLDTDTLASQLDATLLHSKGRSFPVETHYRPLPDANTRLAQHINRVVGEALSHSGDILIFLPGVGDINRVAAQLQERHDDSLLIMPLHSQLSDKEQKAALQPAAAGKRKILLATNIAESSLTIDGVRIVIDSGLERRMSFSPQSGISELKTRAVSQASATQRQGRAGRQAPGICFRLWTESEQSQRDAHIRAEILDSDLAPLLMELCQWGAAADELLWLDPPSTASLNQARTLLQSLDICTAEGQLTDHGRRCAATGIEPRWAHALLKASELGMAAAAADVIALLQEWPHKQRFSDDIQRLLQNARQNPLWKQRVLPLQQRLLRTAALSDKTEQQVADYGLILALAWPDRIARRRNATKDSFLLANGTGAELSSGSNTNTNTNTTNNNTSDCLHAEWLAIADISGGRPARIRMAAELPPATLTRLQACAPHLFRSQADVRWLDNGQLQAEEQLKLGNIVVSRKPLPSMSADQWLQVWDAFFAAQGLASLNWDESAMNLRQRLALAHTHDPQHWPDMSDDSLIRQRHDWLLPFCHNARHQRDLKKVALSDALKSLLSWEQQQQLEKLLPSHWTVASGSRIALDYGQTPPVLAVKLREMFGCEDQPAVMNGRQPLVIHLLSPARRPLQVTSDLPHFWRNTYAEVRKDMRGRYPRHPWPEDPLSAEATRLTKRAIERRDKN